MMTFIAVSICIVLPLVPQLIALWLAKDLFHEESFVTDYR